MSVSNSRKSIVRAARKLAVSRPTNVSTSLLKTNISAPFVDVDALVSFGNTLTVPEAVIGCVTAALVA